MYKTRNRIQNPWLYREFNLSFVEWVSRWISPEDELVDYYDGVDYD